MYINVWICECMQSLLTDAKVFINSLFTFDKDNIPDRIIKASLLTLERRLIFWAPVTYCMIAYAQGIAPYMDDPNFTPAAIERSSKACTAICMWARAMYKVRFYAFIVTQMKNEKWINRMYHLCSITSSLLEWHPREPGWRKLRYDTACRALDDDK